MPSTHKESPSKPDQQLSQHSCSRSSTPIVPIDDEQCDSSRPTTPIVPIEDEQHDSSHSPFAPNLDQQRSYYSGPTIPIVLNDDDDNYHSRPTTPIVSEVNINRQTTSGTSTSSGTKHHQEKRERQLVDVLVKQGKQIRALYDILKGMNEKLLWIQGQIKKQNKDKDIDLSPKVFSVSVFIFKHHITFK